MGLLHYWVWSWPSRYENIVSSIATGDATNSDVVDCVQLPDDEMGVYEDLSRCLCAERFY